MATRVTKAEKLKALEQQIKALGANVVIVPEGYATPTTIKRNVSAFLKKNGSTVAHLIMLIHEKE